MRKIIYASMELVRVKHFIEANIMDGTFQYSNLEQGDVFISMGRDGIK